MELRINSINSNPLPLLSGPLELAETAESRHGFVAFAGLCFFGMFSENGDG